LSKICQILSTTSEYTYLFADEVPVGDNFSKLNRHAVNCSIALQTFYTHDSPAVIDPPSDMSAVHLQRIYRYTQEIARFVEGAMKVLEAGGPYKRMCGRSEPGHEVRGEVPECLLLPPCPCPLVSMPPSSCCAPEKHILEDRSSTISALLRRLKKTAGTTILFDVNWGFSKLGHDNFFKECKKKISDLDKEVKVVSVEEFRGCEAEVLLWIGDSLSQSLLESLTRVTGKLVLVALPPRVDNNYAMAGIMEEACREGWAGGPRSRRRSGIPVTSWQRGGLVFICRSRLPRVWWTTCSP